MSAKRDPDAMVSIGDFEVPWGDLDKVERALQQYHSIKDRLHFLKKRLPQVPFESAPPADGMPRGSAVGNPTAGKVGLILSIEQDIREIEAWLEAVDRIQKRLQDPEKVIAQKLWFDELPETDNGKLATAASCSRREVYRIKQETLLKFYLVLRNDASTVMA